MRSLIYDSNGNYVIFKMLESYDKIKMEFIIPVVEESVYHQFICSFITWPNKSMVAKSFTKSSNNILLIILPT